GRAKPLPLPAEILGSRRNSLGLPLTEPLVRDELYQQMGTALAAQFSAGPIVEGAAAPKSARPEPVTCPHDRSEWIGTVVNADVTLVATAVKRAEQAAHGWDMMGGTRRAQVLERAADLYERDRATL